MAKKRDVIIGVIIGVTFLVCIGFFGLMFIGAFLSDDGSAFGGFSEKIAVVEVYGTIYDSKETVRQLKKWGKSESIKAIIVHIDSPGGAVAPSQEIYDEIIRIRTEEDKIVVASMLSVAASGGYLIACAADTIIANAGTITGSIGVILQYPTAGKLFERVGVEYQTVKSGELKDVGALDRPMSDNERKMLNAMIMDTYEQFVDVVEEGRELDRDAIYSLANGSIFSGRQALELGLIDELGSFEQAVRMTAEMAEIDGEPDLMREYKKKQSIFDLMGSVLSNFDSKISGNMSSPRVMYLY